MITPSTDSQALSMDCTVRVPTESDEHEVVSFFQWLFISTKTQGFSFVHIKFETVYCHPKSSISNTLFQCLKSAVDVIWFAMQHYLHVVSI